MEATVLCVSGRVWALEWQCFCALRLKSTQRVDRKSHNKCKIIKCSCARHLNNRYVLLPQKERERRRHQPPVAMKMQLQLGIKIVCKQCSEQINDNNKLNVTRLSYSIHDSLSKS